MTRIALETNIDALPERCFDLMRDIRVHTATTAETNERAVSGVTDGIIGLGQIVTFEGRHFGFTQRLTVKVIEFDRPNRFVDAMVEGRFRSFVHVHEFEAITGGTMMRDTLIWESPFGVFGKLFDAIILKKHMRGLVVRRNARLKEIAESNGS